MASLMCYQKLRKSLKLEGYEFNTYNPYVSKKITKNKQMKICFHVDHFKLSHTIPKVAGKN